MDRKKMKDDYLEKIKEIICRKNLKRLEDASDDEWYSAVAEVAMKDVTKAWRKTEELYRFCDLKQINYLTPEALPGRVLVNNLLNCGSHELLKEILDERNISLEHLENLEEEPALGNGGLGRLTSCTQESLTTQGYNACTHTLKYKKGLSKQRIIDGKQVDFPDYWDKAAESSLVKRKDFIQTVTFGGGENVKRIEAVPYDLPIVGFPTHGYEDVRVTSLRLWEAANEPEITESLYPSDKTTEGKRLRLKQQYFLASASTQLIVAQFKKQYGNFDLFTKKVAIHVNDTHPALAIPELMRILMDENGFGWDEAWEITTKCCSYTNHTIMKEAQEIWSIEMFKKLLPRVYQIIEEINKRFVAKLRNDYLDAEQKVKEMAILYDGQIRMANMAVIGSYFVNGVAKVHTEILKNKVFKEFNEIYEDKIHNITNGVTQRLFLLSANPLLSQWITEKCRTSKWFTQMECVKKLEEIADDKKFQDEFFHIKYLNKVRLAKEIRKKTGIVVDTKAIFDVQVKRQHEYKRQLMNLLGIRYLYDMLKTDEEFLKSFHPMVYIFAGKAHPDYTEAKLIIEEIHKAADEINNDKEIKGKMKIVFLENYNVSLAKIIFPASDVSEQISTASKEASGTGNMKFMMNGAITLGTLDGANIEIMEAVGKENMFIFGATSDQILNLEEKRDYIASHIYSKDERVKRVVDKLCPHLRNTLLYGQSPTVDADRYFVLLDLHDYIRARLEVNKAYKDPSKWAHMAIMNIANSGGFSIDYTVKKYAKIWGLESIYED